MKLSFYLTLLLAVLLPSADAQVFPGPQYFSHLFARRSAASNVPGPEKLHDYVVDGKLQLSLNDAVRLATLNDTSVRINELELELAALSVQRAYQPR